MALLPLPGPVEDIDELIRALRLAFDQVERHERWHTVGDADEVQYQNGWGATADFPAQFRRNALGDVFIRGEISSAAGAGTGNNTVAFTLPEGYRPPVAMRFTVSGSSGPGAQTLTQVLIATTGAVTLQIVGVANNAQATVRLGTITFRPQ